MPDRQPPVARPIAIGSEVFYGGRRFTVAGIQCQLIESITPESERPLQELSVSIEFITRALRPEDA